MCSTEPHPPMRTQPALRLTLAPSCSFTPFCDDKPEMNGFRFWKSGFWKDHLKEKPYHISALYVVDLARLRRIGAADQLRYGAVDSTDVLHSTRHCLVATALAHSAPLVRPTTRCRAIRAAWRTSTRTCPTSCRCKCRSSRCRRSGFGARHGARTPARRRLRPSIWCVLCAP